MAAQMIFSISLALLITSCATSAHRSPSSVSNNYLNISVNQPEGQPEHLGGVDVIINGRTLPLGIFSNDLANDSSGFVTLPMSVDSDPQAKLVLAVDNHANGHKVSAGMSLNLVMGDGSKHLLATTEGEPVPGTDAYSYR